MQNVIFFKKKCPKSKIRIIKLSYLIKQINNFKKLL